MHGIEPIDIYTQRLVAETVNKFNNLLTKSVTVRAAMNVQHHPIYDLFIDSVLRELCTE